MRARGEPGDRVDAILEPLGLSRQKARDPRALSFAEQRAVELALALSTPAPLLLALHEPLCDVALPRLDAIHLRLREAAASGTCVIVTTSSPADARALGDRVLVLHRGAVAREVDGEGLAGGESTTIQAWVRTGARELGAALTLRPEVRAVSWRDATGGSPAVVEVSGDRAQDCALAIIESALAVEAEVEAMTETAPTLGQVRSTTESLWAALRKKPAPASKPAQEEAAAPAEEPAPEAEEPAAPPTPAASPEEQRSAP
jgi:ABC-type multidrug transport system ATPase subunit